MKNLIYSFSCLIVIAAFTSCSEDPEGLRDFDTVRDSVQTVLAKSDSTAAFFGAWKVNNIACSSLPAQLVYFINIRPDGDNYPNGLFAENIYPEYANQLTGIRLGNSCVFPVASYINEQGDTLSLTWTATITESSDSTTISGDFLFERNSDFNQSCIITAVKNIE